MRSKQSKKLKLTVNEVIIEPTLGGYYYHHCRFKLCGPLVKSCSHVKEDTNGITQQFKPTEPRKTVSKIATEGTKGV